LKTHHTDKFQQIQKELDLYKVEYERLYQETLPELIPEYIKDNYDPMDAQTLYSHVDYIQWTKRDVQFFIKIIKSNDNAPKTPRPTSKPKPITPNPFRNFLTFIHTTNHNILPPPS
jgi:hypothetical protein